MAWQLRHEGSPQPVPQALTTEQIVEGMRDGVYAISDEVRGNGNNKWVKLEKHPHFAEVAEVVQEIESQVFHEPEDDNIDMNPLIDVCLVLLVFFILATTMSVMEKVLNLPKNQMPDKTPRPLTADQVQKYIMVKVEKKGAATIFKVNDYETTEANMLRELERMIKEGKSEMILDIGPGVDFGNYTLVIDKSHEARITKILTKAPNKGGSPAKGAPAKSPPGKAPAK